jgi:hypothetical protein
MLFHKDVEVSFHMFSCEHAVREAENSIKIKVYNFDRMNEQLPE